MPMTMRQIFYRLIGAGIIQNCAPDYERLCSALAEERSPEELPPVVRIVKGAR